MVGYYILGGPMRLQMGGMGGWTYFMHELNPRKRRGRFDHCIVPAVLSGDPAVGRYRIPTVIPLNTGAAQPTAWRPYLWPVK